MRESPPSTTPTPTYESELQRRTAETKSAGTWMLWTGLILAVLWWASSGYGAYAWVGIDSLRSMPTALMLSAAGLVILPGLILIFAAALAQQVSRARAANALVLLSSEALLSPAKTAEGDIRNLAEATKHSSALINKSSQEAMASLTAISKNMEDERMRAESVGYAMADNARDLTERLANERQALEALSRKLDEQAAVMTQAMPAQLANVDIATEKAKETFAATDALLRERIQELENTSGRLASQLANLDHLSSASVQTTEALHSSIHAIETRLAKTQKSIEIAEKASSMAVDAAAQTGQALTDAVSGALDRAREANNEITEKTLLIQETSSRTMEELRKTGAAAANTAARIQEQSRGILEEDDDDLLEAPIAPEPPTAEPPHIHQRPVAPETAEFNSPIFARRPLRTRRVYNDPIDPIKETQPPAEETDLFEEPSAHAEEAMELGAETTPVYLTKTKATSAHREQPTKTAPQQSSTNGEASEWRDIIAEMDVTEDAQGVSNAAHPVGDSAREVTAEELISHLQNSGIPLPTAFRARDKKKIAAAARKDHALRRKAIRSAAGQQVDRVAVRLNKDDHLMALAQRFVAAEETDALKALEDTQKLGRHASPRLSAYLLVDTALSRNA